MKRLFHVILRIVVVLLFFILLVFALREARTLLYPIVLAILFSYLLYPVARWLEKKGFHRILANFIVIIGGLAIIGTVIYILYTQLAMLLDDLPELQQQAQRNVDQITRSVSSSIGMSTNKFKSWFNSQTNSVFEQGGVVMNTLYSSTTEMVMTIGLMPVYVFLLLFYRNKFYDFFMMIWPEEQKIRGMKIVHRISQVTKRYMGGVFTVVLILCFINSAGLLIIGVKYAILLGIISAICNFIPYFGTLIGAVFPLLMAIFAGESPNEAVGVIIMFVLVQFTENNILTPNITGGSVQINPFVTILSIIAGGMVWGLPGMFVIVPVMGMLKIVFESYSSTKPFAYLLGPEGTEEHALNFERLRTFFLFKKSAKNKENEE